LGYFFGALRRMDVTTLTDVVVYLGGPALVYTALVDAKLDPNEAGLLAAGAVVLVLGPGLLLAAVVRQPRGLLLPAMFMNAGNMLLPLCLFAFGKAGLARGTVIFVVVAALHSTLGVTIASGRWTLGPMLRLPFIYAVVAAFAVRSGWLVLPEIAIRIVALLSQLAIPLMLLALGLRLRSVRIDSWRRPLLAGVARMGGGYLCGLAFVTAFGVAGTSRACLLLAATMPSAVVNFAFAETYRNEPAEVAATVVLTTLASVVAAPLVLALGV
ncbi:MAG: hypothetical protein D6760_13730, partial [Deltaproteobacteria bacterium]